MIASTWVHDQFFGMKILTSISSYNNIQQIDMYAPSFAKLFSLYCSLQYGVVIQDWIEQNQIADYNIDVRYVRVALSPSHTRQNYGQIH